MESVVLNIYWSAVVRFSFFYNRNTADEMRISDWSSDVCSSDLLARLRVGEQPLDAGSQNHARARDRGILIGAFDLPPLTRCAFAADTLLVGDRRRTLLIGGIAGIERGADHDIFLWRRAKRTPARLPHYASLARHDLRDRKSGV